MTNEEAHGYMEDLQRIFTQYRFIFSKELTEANGKAIEALEKQIPKKPSVPEVERYTYKYICPQCGCPLEEAYPVLHCMNCGQAIDWSDE